MKSHSTKILILFMLVFVLVLCSFSTAFAVKPTGTLSVQVTGVTPTSVTFDVNWNKTAAYRADVYVSQYTLNAIGTYSPTGYNIAMGEIPLLKRTSTYSGTVTMGFDYAQYSNVPASGSYGKIRLVLWDRKNNQIADTFSDYFLIP